MPFDGKKLKEIRLARGVSKELLAVKIERTHGSVVGYEAGTIEPPIRVVEAIAAALDAELLDFISGDPKERKAV